MQSGEAPIAESSTVQALRERKWSRRQPLPRGLISLLTLGFWAVWLYLVMPLVSLVLWVLGVRFFILELAKDGIEGLRASLIAYSSILVLLVGLLAVWIVWNVVRYGGQNDRRMAKKEEASDEDIRKAFRLDGSLLGTLRTERLLRIDLDPEGCVVLAGATPPVGPGPGEAETDGRAALDRRQRDRE